MTTEERYYYSCAEHVESREVHCMRDTSGFTPLPAGNSNGYRHTIRMSLQKVNMDRIHKSITPVPGTGLLASLTNAFSLLTASGETGEEILMKQEFKGKRVVIIDPNK